MRVLTKALLAITLCSVGLITLYSLYSQTPVQAAAHKHKCVHNEIVKKFKPRQPKLKKPFKIAPESTQSHELNLRKHGQSNWQPIRVFFDYSNLDATRVTQKLKDLIKNQFMKIAYGYFTQVLTVYPLQTGIKFYGYSTCGDSTIPATYLKNGLAGYDMIFFVTAKAGLGDAVAYAGTCIFEPKANNRPTIGHITFSSDLFEQVIAKNQDWTSHISTAMHEMYHAFGFSNSAFKYYVDATGKPLGINNVVAKVNNINYIIMPEVKKLAANYFNCATVNGGTLENEGGSGSAGSHWERVTFGNEAMTASEFDDSVFSIFTLKLMKGTGWYLPNEDRAQLFVWGRQQGCEIANGICSNRNFQFSCGVKQDAEDCTTDYMGVGVCDSDQFSSGCKYLQMYGNEDCRQAATNDQSYSQIVGGVRSPSSRCLDTNLFSIQKMYTFSRPPRFACYQSSCSADKKSVIINIGPISRATTTATTVTCTADGQTVSIPGTRGGTITCPLSIFDFCLYENKCPNSCSGRGNCINQRCICYDGFKGADCSQNQ